MEHSIELFFLSDKEIFKDHQKNFKVKNKRARFCELGIINDNLSESELIPFLNPVDIKTSPKRGSVSIHYLSGSNFETTCELLESYIEKFEVNKYYIKVYSDEGEKVFEKNTYNPIIDPVFGEILYFTPGHYGKGRGWLLRFHDKTEFGFDAELLDYKGYGIPDETTIKKIILESPWKYENFDKYYVRIDRAKMYAYLFKQSGIIIPEQIEGSIDRKQFESMNELTHERCRFTEETQEELDKSIRKIERLTKSIAKLDKKSSLSEEDRKRMSRYRSEKKQEERYRNYCRGNAEKSSEQAAETGC